MEISITKGLRELKTLDARVTKKINDGLFVHAMKKDDRLPRQFKNEDEFKNNAKETLQSINDLMSRRKSIKTAIVESNAKTPVEISGIKMTVADAIERKNYIGFEKALLQKLKYDYSTAENRTHRNNEYASEKLQSNLNQILSKEGKSDMKFIDQYKEHFWEDEKTSIIDPIGVISVIDEMERDIETFEEEVDTVLSESNSVTKITIVD